MNKIIIKSDPIDLSDVSLTKEQKKHIRACVNRFLRMKRKRFVRNTVKIILFPATAVWKLK